MTTNNKDNNEWDFNNLKLSDAPKKEQEILTPKKVQKPTAKTKLILDEAPPLKTKTRSEMAHEMQGNQDRDESDVYNLASVPKRGIACIIDFGFLAAIFYFVSFSAPYTRKIIQYCLDLYKLEFFIPERFVMSLIIFLTGFITLFCLVIIPLSFFNHSFGKKILGLKVRGKHKYTISVGEAIKRELIMKPISVLIIAGFVTPFFSKNKLSIHDMLTDTFVIED